MRYRAVAVGLEKGGRPVQIIGNVLGPVNDWAAEIVRNERVPVDIFILEECLVRREIPEVEG